MHKGLITCSLCVLLATPDMFGWSREGHQTIAIIAASRLAGTYTAQRIASILGTLRLEEIATCPDEARNLDQYGTPMSAVCENIFSNHPKGTGPLHFVNIPVTTNSFTPKAADVSAACNDDCVISAIAKYLAVLKATPSDQDSPSNRDEIQALSFIVHFIGDIHQPLHDAIRNNDAGGNAEHITFFGDKLVLHGIWDNQIVARINADPSQLATQLHPQIETAAGEAHTTSSAWAIQAYKIARDTAYKGIPAADGINSVATLEQPYQDAAAPKVDLQLARAGVRLAAALKSALP